MGYGIRKVDQKCYVLFFVQCKWLMSHEFASNLILKCSKFHLIQGDWREHHRANKDSLYVIESVVESLLQLLIQSILVYVVLGPGAGLGWHFFATLYFDQPHVKIF